MKKILLLAIMACTVTAQAQTHYVKTQCGTEFTLALRSDSTLWGWGENGNGQLTGVVATMTDNPTQLQPTQKWIDIAAGSFHTLAIAADSTLWGWGFNQNGELGTGTLSANATPTQVVAGAHWKNIAAGEAHSIGIKGDGTLWATGYNAYGQLGTGDTTSRIAWTQIGTASDWKSVSAGGVFTLAIKQDGTLWAWGYNGDGELGLNSTSFTQNTPIQVGADNDWKMTSAGFEFALALKTGGTLWSAGINANNNLGRTTTGGNDSVFAQVNAETNWSTIAAGSAYGMAIKTDGSLWGWGFDGNGQLGGGMVTASQALTQIGTDMDWSYMAVADGSAETSLVIGGHSVGFHTNATALCAAGAGYVGQLGDETYWPGSVGDATFECDVAPIVPEAVVDVKPASLDITLSPNPALSTFTISGLKQAASYDLFDMTGRQVLHGTAEPVNAIDISMLPQGQYLVQVICDDAKQMLRVVKE